MPLSTKDAFVLEFVLELRCERRCNAKKSRIAQVDIAPLVTMADSTKDPAQFIVSRGETRTALRVVTDLVLVFSEFLKVRAQPELPFPWPISSLSARSSTPSR
jgi:hypothetical protein